MVGVIKRMHHLRERLLWIRMGPGAAKLPPTVSRIHLEFAKRNEGGHMGPRKFMKENLPRLKFWNPAVPMIVNRTPDSEGPATLTLYFREDGTPNPRETPQPPSSTTGASKAPAPVAGEKAVTIDIKGVYSTEILDKFIERTSAVPVQPTQAELEEAAEIAELRRRGEIDRAENAKLIAEKKREQARLKLAMSEAAAIKAAATV
ncbi:CI-B8 domain-containing protein [Podospora conica]|nr:CI-B8 domain-containing protein [Schizothecium conicum]